MFIMRTLVCADTGTYMCVCVHVHTLTEHQIIEKLFLF
jgi:hypothetical protein